LRAFGGGAAGVSSANTGLGSMMVVGGEAKSPELRITWTGTVTGWNLGFTKVTENQRRMQARRSSRGFAGRSERGRGILPPLAPIPALYQRRRHG
jgi:hypothetical protein